MNFDKLFSSFKANLFVIVAVLLILMTNLNIKRWDSQQVIKWDITSYYGYLPAIFIHNDLKLDFVDDNKEYYAENQMFWPEIAPNGNKVIKTTAGLSILYAPFFAIAHLEAKLTNQKQDGFSIPYHKWVHLSLLFYLVFGLYYLNKFLSKTFDSKSSALTITCILFGTNLFYYSTTESAMSHGYIFALLSVFIYFFDVWYVKANYKNTLIIAFIMGLLVLIRPTNIFILWFALFYKVGSIKALFSNLRLYILKRSKFLIIIATISFLIVLPQLIYWHIQTGSWIYNSYTEERFYFNNPYILNFLFGFRKGWFIYTPIMLFSFVGFVVLFKKNRALFFSTFPIIALLIFVLSSWWCWWFGGSFGMRAMIDFYPVLAIPFAALVFYIFSLKQILPKAVFTFILLGFVSLNLFQTDQYRKGIIHWDSMTKEAYFKTFGKRHKNEAFQQYFKTPDYENAKNGKKEYSK